MIALSNRLHSFPFVFAMVAGIASCTAQEWDDDIAEPTEDATATAQEIKPSELPDCLYVGDNVPGTVDDIERYDPSTGFYYGSLIRNAEVKPDAVTGLIFNRSGTESKPDLFALDLHSSTLTPGEVYRYRVPSGKFRDRFVSSTTMPDANALVGPRGALVHNGILYVADVGGTVSLLPGTIFPGRIMRYNANNGQFLGKFDFPANQGPRGIVMNTDKTYLYAAVVNHLDQNAGQIVRFNLLSSNPTPEVVVDSATCNCELRRPEGAVIGPDGFLYVASFRNNSDATSVDKILIFDISGSTGVLQGDIPLWTINADTVVARDRAFAQAMVFGPKGKLYVPITGNGTATTGQLRVYDVVENTFTLLAPAGGPLQTPVYPTFCGTHPATLAYEPRPQCACGL